MTVTVQHHSRPMPFLLAAALVQVAATPPANGLHATALFSVRAQVVQTCTVSGSSVRCRGGAGGGPIAVTTTPSGVRVVEF